MTTVLDSDQVLVKRGRWCVGAALVGVAQGLAVLAWPQQVADDRFSYPFTSAWYVVAQATFFLQHLPLIAAVAAVAALPAVRRDKAAYVSLVVATVGLGLLALMELVATAGAPTAEESGLGVAINSAYGLPVVLIGIGLLVGGIVLLRRQVLAVSWPLLALGLWVVVGLTPALSSNSFVAGRLAIMAWMALFAVLGLAMQRPSRH